LSIISVNKKRPKIVIFDLETLPILPEVMRVLPGMSDYYGRTLKADINSIICFGYKVYGDRSTKCINAWDFSAWKKCVNDDYEICKISYEILKDADAIVTHNGTRFDWKFLQTRLFIHKLPSLPKIQHIDTRILAKRFLFLFDNKLNTVAKHAGTRKLKHDGWDMWTAVSKRDLKYMRLMTRYCKQDVNALEAIFKRLLPFVTTLPNYNMFRRDGSECCPNCGGFNLKSEGIRATKEKTYRKYCCKDCGTWIKGHVKSKHSVL